MHSENKRKFMETEKDLVKCEICKYTGVTSKEVQNHIIEIRCREGLNTHVIERHKGL